MFIRYIKVNIICVQFLKMLKSNSGASLWIFTFNLKRCLSKELFCKLFLHFLRYYTDLDTRMGTMEILNSFKFM